MTSEQLHNSPLHRSTGSRSTPIDTIGAIFFVYGLLAMLLVELLMLIGLQGARPGMYIRPALAFTLVIPALVALTGRALIRGWPWTHGAAVLLPLLIVPLAGLESRGPRTRRNSGLRRAANPGCRGCIRVAICSSEPRALVHPDEDLISCVLMLLLEVVRCG